MSDEGALQVGLNGSISLVVSEKHTARSMGSGQRDVLSTPSLVALLEAVAQSVVAPALGANRQTVGVHLELTHNAATPVGMRVTGFAELVAINGRTLDFRLTARDEMEEIASGTHSRTVARTATLDRMLQKKQGN